MSREVWTAEALPIYNATDPEYLLALADILQRRKQKRIADAIRFWVHNDTSYPFAVVLGAANDQDQHSAKEAE